MPGFFTAIEAADPHQLPQLIWEKALVRERALIFREWAALDRRNFRVEPESCRTQYSAADVGRLRASRVTTSRAIQFAAPPPVAEILNIHTYERGAGRLILPGSAEPAIGNTAAGLINTGESGISAAAGDDSSQLILRLPASLLRQKLEALLGGQRVESLVFQPSFDQTRGAGATIRRMIGFLFAELEHSDSLLANEIAIRGFEDNLALALLLGLPHEYSAGLSGRQPPPRRAMCAGPKPSCAPMPRCR